MTATALRFCIVSTFYPPFNFGGDGIYAHRLANGLARRGQHVTVIHSPTAYEMLSGNSPRNAEYDDHPNVEVHGLRTPLGKMGLLAVQQSGHPVFQKAALRKWLSGQEYDVIHYNNVSLLGGPHAFRMGRGLKLCTLIEHWLVCPMHVLWKFDREVCTQPQCLRCVLHGKRPPQLWRYTGLMRRATKHIDAFVGPSLFTMNKHAERGIKGLMIQLPLFHPEPTPVNAEGHDPARPFFLFVGRLEKIKGVQNIIPVFRGLPNVDLVIAGDGDYASELKELAKGAVNIRLVGRVEHGALQALYRDALATIVPSLCYETFGVVVAESYSARTPVIVRAASSLEELVSKYGGGLMYRTENELRDAVGRLLDDEELRGRLGEEGRRAYDEEFAEDAFLEHYMAVVRDLIRRKQSGKLNTARAIDGDVLAGREVVFA